MEPITVGAIVRSFAQLLLADSMSPRKKQVFIIIFSVFLFMGYTMTHSTFSLSNTFDSLLNGLTAGLSAIGIYHLTQKEEPTLG